MVFAALAFVWITAAAGQRNDGMTHRQAIWDEGQCASRLSTGPNHWEVEIQLAGLPRTTADAKVHLNWWSPRRSPSPYNPLVTPVNCSVYSSIIHAYPSYDARDFNGGNVEVSSLGEATIRVAAPATYFVWRWVAIPHIHLRYCMGTGDALKSHTLGLVMAGPDRWIVPEGSGITIASTTYRRNDVELPTTATVRPSAIIVGVSGGSFDTTTTGPYTTMDPSTRNVLLEATRNSIDVRALTFSPIYACLLEGKFFNHFSSTCTLSCPANSVADHGQCVRPNTVDPAADFNQQWELTIECDQDCWNNAKTVALHNMRLAVAGHLDIPFQEVQVSFGFKTSRRLQAAASQAVLTAAVQSSRLTVSDGTTLMGSFPASASSLTSILGLNVLSVTTGAQVTPGSQDTQNNNNDPYKPAYDEAENNVAVPPTTSVLDGLPTEAIIGIAAGILVLALCFGIYVVVRRRRQRKAQEQATVAAKTESKTQEDNAQNA